MADREIRARIRECQPTHWFQWNQWRKSHPHRNLDLTFARFSGEYLQNFDLSGADLRGALMVGTSLHKANLSRANLSYAHLSMADLRDANLAGAELRET